jgi:tRNA(Ile)-lysidine synthetase-like protein
LYLRELPLDPMSGAVMDWDWRQSLELGAGCGRLIATHADQGLDAARLPGVLTVNFRRGGERVHPAGREHHHKLKKLLHERGVLPWWRNRIPLIWSGDTLVAIGDLWIAEEFSLRGPGAGVRIVWEQRPAIMALDAHVVGG